MPMDDPTLRRFATRAALRPEYLAWVFAQYRRLRGPASETLAEYLGLDGRELLRLSLCLRPREEHFESDARRIATNMGADAFRLAEVIRFVEVLDALKLPESATDGQPSATTPGLLLAARARECQDGDDSAGHQDRASVRKNQKNQKNRSNFRRGNATDDKEGG